MKLYVPPDFGPTSSLRAYSHRASTSTLTLALMLGNGLGSIFKCHVKRDCLNSGIVNP